MASKAVYFAVAIAGIAAASAGAWWYQSRPQGPIEIKADAGAVRSGATASAPVRASSAPRAAGVEVAKAERARLQDDAQSVGTLRSRQSVMLRPEVPGRIKELGFVDGAVVRKGQLLVQLDDTLQKAEIKQAQAQVSIAQANLRRNQELVAQSFVARRVLDESGANLQVAEAQLALACARWSRMAILAPFDGTLGIRNINPGDFVKDGADLVNLEDISSMYADFRLPERFQGKLRPRQDVQLQLDAFPGRVFKARIEAIDPLLDANGRSVAVRAVLPNTMGEPLVVAGLSGAPGATRGAAAGGAGAGGRAAGTPGAVGPTGKSGAPAAGDATRGAGRPPAASLPVPAGGPRAAAADASRAASARGLPAEAVLCSTVTGPAPASGDGAASAAAASPSASGLRSAGASTGMAAASGRQGAAAPLRPGMFARVTTVFTVRESAIVVPEEAIVPQGGRQFVIKVATPAQLPEATRQAVPADTQWVSLRQEVRLGARQLGKVEVTDGLAEGETVVVAGQQRLQRDGTPVRIVELGRAPERGGSGAPGAAGAASAAAAAPGARSPSSGASAPAGAAAAQAALVVNGN